MTTIDNKNTKKDECEWCPDDTCSSYWEVNVMENGIKYAIVVINT